MTHEEFKTVAINHTKWMLDMRTGKQAMLQDTDLSGIDLPGINLKQAELRGANLSHANLPRIDLSYATLTDADFSYACLDRVNLSATQAQNTNFHRTKLCSVNLQHAFLQGADLSYTDLRHANLLDAIMKDVNITGATLPDFQIPQHGELRVYKKVQGIIVHLLIPSWARRTACLVSRKCRANAAVVLAIEGDNPIQSRPWTGLKTDYEIGKTVYPDNYDPDPRVDCTHGIHFFLTREEAKQWLG